jgi:hypothetical protein
MDKADLLGHAFQKANHENRTTHFHSNRSAMIREKILGYIGIKNRFYAMKNNKPTHLNAAFG